MRQFLLVVLLFCSQLYSQAQSEQNIYTKVEVEASFPGGPSAWNSYIKGVLKEKMSLLKNERQEGYVTVTFIVDKEGNVSEIKAETMQGSLISKIVIDAINRGPKWIPATQAGQNVNAWHRHSVTFRLPEE